MIEPVDQRMQRGEIGILLIRVEGHPVVMTERVEFVADTRQPCRVGRGISSQLELEITRTGVFAGVGDAALTFNGVIKADGMPDSDARQRLSACEKLRDVSPPQIG